MSDEMSLAERLYGGVSAAPRQQQAEGLTILGGAPVEKPPVRQAEPAGADSKPDPGAALYPEGGDVPASFEPVVNGALEPLAREARLNGDHTEAQVIDTAMKELGAVFTEYAVGQQHASEVMAEASSFLTTQKSDDAIILEQSNTEDALKAKYGADYEKNIAGAQRVIREMGARVPNLVAVLSRTGLGNSQKAVEAAVAVARRKGYIR